MKTSSQHFYSFLESIATEDNVDELLPIVEGYCLIHGIDNQVLTEASFNEFARKHGGKVKAFMAGLMLLASVASAGTNHSKVNVDEGGHPYSGKAQTQMSSSGHDGEAEGTADAQKLLNLLKNDKVDNNELYKQFDAMKSHANDPGYMKAMNHVMNGAGVDTSKLFDGKDVGNGDHGYHTQAKPQADMQKLQVALKNTESNDEQTALSMGQDTLRQMGIGGHSVTTQELPNGNFVAVLSK
jgi:hypothetical protein